MTILTESPLFGPFISAYSDQVPEFTASSVRSELEPFDPSQPTLCDRQVRAYRHHYGFDSLPDDTDYSIGMESIQQAQLVVQYFQSRSAIGTVVIVHGYTDHAGLYRSVIDYLLRLKWSVLVYDLPGHGLSLGDPLGIDDFNTYVTQLNHLLQTYRAIMGRRLVLLGQSTGAAIIMSQQIMPVMHLMQPLHIDQRILLAPLLRPTRFERIKKLYRLVGWFRRRYKRDFTDNSGDPEFLAFVRQRDPLQHMHFSMNWIRAMLKWVPVMEAQRGVEGAPLIIQGDEDVTVDWQHNLPLFEQIFPKAETYLIRGGRHHLVNDALEIRKQVFVKIGECLAKLNSPHPIDRRSL